LDEFIKQIGFSPVLFEKGGIPFDYDKDTDISCYDEVKASDLYILIIGGRYGSMTSNELKHIRKRMKRYNSITKKEYETALEADLPMHIFIDSAVANEYRTWLNNSRSMDIQYAYVDNPSIFLLIEKVYNSPVSQYVQTFSEASDISNWLREQWAGLFRRYLKDQKKKIAADRVSQVRTKINCFKLFYFRRSQGYQSREWLNYAISLIVNIEATKHLLRSTSMEFACFH